MGKPTHSRHRRYLSTRKLSRKKVHVLNRKQKQMAEANSTEQQYNLTQCTLASGSMATSHRKKDQDREDKILREFAQDSGLMDPSHRVEGQARAEEVPEACRSFRPSHREEERDKAEEIRSRSAEECETMDPSYREEKQDVVDEVPSRSAEECETMDPSYREEEQDVAEEVPSRYAEDCGTIDPSDGEGDQDTAEELVSEPDEEQAIDDMEGDRMDMETAVFGRCIVNFPYIFKQLGEQFDNHNLSQNCLFSDLRVVKSQRLGLNTRFFLQCQRCNTGMTISTDRDDANRMDVNRCAVSGTISTGIGHSQMEEFLASMDIRCMAAKTYRKYNFQLHEAFEKATATEIASAAEESRKAAIERGDYVIHDGEKVPFTTVVADCSWMKRSYKTGRYDSLSGVGAILDYHTGKVLYRGVRNKFCAVCEWAERHGKEPTTHECFKNWGRDQASTGMEPDAIACGFEKSVKDTGLIYKTLIADGDSSVYKAILDSNPYEKYGITVKKKECVNHLKRNLINKLKKIGEKTGRSISRERKVVTNSVKAFRAAIEMAVEHRRNSVALSGVEDSTSMSTNETDRIALLEKDILNLPYHVFGDHQNCKDLKGFCNGDSAEGEQNVVDALKKAGLFETLREIFGTFSLHAPSLMYNATNNIAEAYNAIVCKLIGGKRINFGMRFSYQTRCDAAVLQYNTQSLLTKLHQSEKKEVPRTVTIVETRRKRKVQLNAGIKRRMKASRSSRRHRRIRGTDKNYGPNAQQPDYPPDVFAKRAESFKKGLLENQQNRIHIEECTRTQADSEQWQALRKQMVTASHFGHLIRMRDTTSCSNAVLSIMFPSIRNTPAIVWGRIHEPIALKALEKRLAEEGNPVAIMRCGLFIDSEMEYLGATPDGTIGNDGIVEIKCPYSARKHSPEEAIRLKISEIPRFFNKSDHTKMNTAHPYYYQVQGQLHITQRLYCLFAVWTPLGLKYVTVLRDDDFWKNQMEQKLIRFYNHCLFPELVNSRYKRKMPVREPEYILAAQEQQRRCRESTRSELSAHAQTQDCSDNGRMEYSSIEKDIDETSDSQPENRGRLMLRLIRSSDRDDHWSVSSSDESSEAISGTRRVQPIQLRKETSANGEFWSVSSSEEHSSNVQSRVAPTVLTWSRWDDDGNGRWAVSSSDEQPRALRSATPLPITSGRPTNPPVPWVVIPADDGVSQIPTPDERALLESVNEDVPIARIRDDILLQESLLNDTSIDNFLAVVRSSSTTFNPKTTLWLTHLRFVTPCEGQDIQIIGGNALRHWRCIYFDEQKLNIYDSLFSGDYDSLKDEERAYIRLRYPNLRTTDVSFKKVQKQPDCYSCGVYAAAFATTLVLGGDPSNATYSADVMKMRHHLLRIIESKKLSAFPRI